MMKSLQGMLIISLLLFTGTACSQGIDFSLIERANIADEDIFQVGSWEGIQISYTPKDTFYTFAAIETASIFPNGYHAFDYNMFGIGMGSRAKINKNLKIFGQFGIHKIKNSWGSRKRKPSEAMEYYLNRKWYGLSGWYGDTEWYSFDEYEVKNSNALSGEVGVEMIFPVDEWFFGGLISYRLMKINEKIAGYRDEWTNNRGPGHYWTTSQTRNYSSINVGFTARYVF